MLTTWGASKGPPCPPRARTRPGGAVARLELALRVPGPRRAQAPLGRHGEGRGAAKGSGASLKPFAKNDTVW